jgi:hypothetical protein
MRVSEHFDWASIDFNKLPLEKQKAIQYCLKGDSAFNKEVCNLAKKIIYDTLKKLYSEWGTELVDKARNDVMWELTRVIDDKDILSFENQKEDNSDGFFS